LQVLGRAEFKKLLRFRLRVREIFGFSTKKKEEADAKASKEAQEGEEVATLESMDEEMQIQEELERLKEKDSKARKKQRRAENERKQKEITRLQMNMTTPFEIGLEQAGPYGEDSVFDLKAVDKAGAINKIARGKMGQLIAREEKPEESEEELETDDEEDHLERDLDAMYGEYVEAKSGKYPLRTLLRHPANSLQYVLSRRSVDAVACFRFRNITIRTNCLGRLVTPSIGPSAREEMMKMENGMGSRTTKKIRAMKSSFKTPTATGATTTMKVRRD
jgi:hypothetical protein